MGSIVGIGILVALLTTAGVLIAFRIMCVRCSSHWSVEEMRGFILRALERDRAGIAKITLWHDLRDHNRRKAVEMVQFQAVLDELTEEGSIEWIARPGGFSRCALSKSLRSSSLHVNCEEIRRPTAGH